MFYYYKVVFGERSKKQKNRDFQKNKRNEKLALGIDLNK